MYSKAETKLVEIEEDDDVFEGEHEDEEDEDRLEIAFAASENALTIANTVSQSVLLQTINNATNVSSYYLAEVPGGVYRESISLQGGEIVDNKIALRSLAQDNLHNKMIEEQYK